MSGLPEVTATEAIQLAEAGTWVLDVREQDEWDRGHSPLTHLLPMSAMTERLPEVPTGQRVLVICHAGSRSLRVTKALQDAGYDAVNVAGGMLAWAEAGGELVSEGSDEPRVG
ncbi:rhodanese-like domain-containing protein [Glaciihabitans sp. UYNi722]|uniref:rhodanese-like domain-containing protein n=1 Tax=Glaciihabitans sp. UYNi722 TaxID=3156344 RepID=UPI003393EB2F